MSNVKPTLGFGAGQVRTSVNSRDAFRARARLSRTERTQVVFGARAEYRADMEAGAALGSVLHLLVAKRTLWRLLSPGER
jgi:hypothetical protein